MSHSKLRHEKTCLNCGHEVGDRFCTHCGQENLQIQDSAFHLILHYIQDLFHYDGKVWATLKKLLLEPGLVASEYMEGKRMRNLEPVRFYVFASTVFFLFLFFSTDNLQQKNDPELNYNKRIYQLNQEKKFRAGTEDTILINRLIDPLQLKLDSLEINDADSSDNTLQLDLTQPIPPDTGDIGWLGKILERRAEERRVEMEKKHEGDAVSAATDFINEVFHKLPVLLFLSMPFFALFLKILYFQSSRRGYVEHFIFSVYYYAFVFMITTLFLVISYLIDKLEFSWVETVSSIATTLFIIYLFLYLWFALQRFYRDRWYYRLPRYFILLTLVSFTMIVLLLLFIVGTFLF